MLYLSRVLLLIIKVANFQSYLEGHLTQKLFYFTHWVRDKEERRRHRWSRQQPHVRKLVLQRQLLPVVSGIGVHDNAQLPKTEVDVDVRCVRS